MAGYRPLKYDNLAVPLFYETEFTQNTKTTPIITLSQNDSAATGDFVSTYNSAGTKLYSVGSNGNPRYRIYTTRPTTGLTKGEVLLLFHGSTPKFGVVTSTAAQTIKLIRLKTKTFGRLTA